MVRPYSFKEKLAESLSPEARELLDQAYADYFPGYLETHTIATLPQQKAGHDALVVFETGNVVKVDEKVSQYAPNKLFLEIWSDVERRKPGWATDRVKSCDYVAYLWSNHGICLIVPYPALRRTVTENAKAYGKEFGVKKIPNTSWTTAGILVPVDRFLTDLGNASILDVSSES